MCLGSPFHSPPTFPTSRPTEYFTPLPLPQDSTYVPSVSAAFCSLVLSPSVSWPHMSLFALSPFSELQVLIAYMLRVSFLCPLSCMRVPFFLFFSLIPSPADSLFPSSRLTCSCPISSVCFSVFMQSILFSSSSRFPFQARSVNFFLSQRITSLGLTGSSTFLRLCPPLSLVLTFSLFTT